MVKKLLLLARMVLLFAWAPIMIAGQTSKSASPDEEIGLTKDDIAMLMVQVKRIPVVQQDRRMEMIWDHLESSETPRSDFLFCTGLAYLGNYKAQACLGRAFEKGKGADKSLANAYIWYAIAFDNPINDPELRQSIRADRDRLKKELLKLSPTKSEKELEDLVKLQKAFRMQCLAEIRDTEP